MKKTIQFLFICCILIACDTAENSSKITNNQQLKNESLAIVEPPNWFVGMQNNELQLLIHHPNIGDYSPNINYKGVQIQKVHKARSKNYLFLDLLIDKTTNAGSFDIIFINTQNDTLVHTYQLLPRQKNGLDYQGFTSEDAIYLITPDRFANGNPQNDCMETLQEKTIDRSNDYARHGGDIQGITQHINYIADLGFTAVWPTPVLTNDMPQSSYHGYAITNYYEVDPRFGTLEEYKNLANELRKKDMKLIMDQVVNHCGINHWWMKDLPFDDWVNNQKNYEDNIENWNWETNINSNHRRTTNQDIYASQADKDGMTDGWFVSAMPDLNQRNPFMATYLIQNSIWWIETLGLGGIRQDTYPYPDKHFMSDWAGAIMHEYPNFSIVGEEWSYNPLLIGYWQRGANNRDGYESNLTSTMDFAMQKNMVDALNEEESWDKGLVKIYEGLANDFHYANPSDILIFPDNHDMSRIFTQLKSDIPNTKTAVALSLILPRIPQIYYGTEILMNDNAKPGDHGLIRSDFPGGWQDDTVNAFTGKGLTKEQKEMQNFVSKLLNYRKNSKAIYQGKTKHFAPFMGTYFLFRIYNDEVLVQVINKNEKPITIDLKRYAEIGLEGKTLQNIITNETFVWGESFLLKERGSKIFTTKIN